MLIEIIIAIGLCLIAVYDIIYKKIPLFMIALLLGVGVVGIVIEKEPVFYLILAGAAVGLVFLIISKVTREALGYGDSLLILVLGIHLGFWKIMILAFIAFFVAAIVATLAIIIKKKGRKASIPFGPFIALSYAIVVFLGV